MSNQQGSYVAASFFQIHAIITRGLRVSIESVQGVLQHGFKNVKDREGLINFIHTLTSVLNAHHLTEDEIAFPYFRDKLPQAPFDILIEWHQEMVKILDEIKVALEKCEKEGSIETNLRDVENALTRLNESWQPHIKMEADEFISKADALIPGDEQLRLTKLFQEHGVKIAVPHYFTVPFMLYNLPVMEREVFSKGMPAEILETLVPVVWKEKWESMIPFLLE